MVNISQRITRKNPPALGVLLSRVSVTLSDLMARVKTDEEPDSSTDAVPTLQPSMSSSSAMRRSLAYHEADEDEDDDPDDKKRAFASMAGL